MDRSDHAAVSETLARAGCVASDAEAAELIVAAEGNADRLAEFVGRRVSGEPTAWIVGQIQFCGSTVKVAPGVYVPRWQSEPLAERAAALLPEAGVALDVCTGSGAIGVVLRDRCPTARVVGTDSDAASVACARENGIEAYQGDLTAPAPVLLKGTVDVLTGVVPYVPTDALRLLARDVLAFEPRHALDGGPNGTRHLIRVADQALSWLSPGGTLLLELGGDQGNQLKHHCEGLGFVDVSVVSDEDGEVRSIEAHGPGRRP